jgi:glycosyltransferase involved in cell wall biosynthesis
MKIVIYSYDHVDNPRCGGGGAYRLLMIHRVLAARHDITIYYGRFSGARAYADHGIRFIPLGFGKSYLLSRVSFSLLANLLSLTAKADIIVNDFSAYAPVFTFLFRRKRTLVQFHHFMGSIPLRKYGIFGLVSMIAEQITLRMARYIMTHGDSVACIIKERFPGKPLIRPTYVGFDENLFCKNVTDEKFILSLGRIDIHMKGLDLLIKAFEKASARFPAYRLIIAGRGPDDQISRMRQMIAASSAGPKIELRQSVSADEKKTLLRSATFVCMPSRFEGWCIVAIEAGASSKATLGTDIPGLRDTIQNGTTGILVNANDVDALARGMEKILGDSDLRKRLGTGGYAWAGNFTWDKVARNQEECYEFVTKERKRLSQ